VALTKIQSFIKKLSESQNVKKVVGDIQTLSSEIQKRVHTLNADQAVKKYKDIMKKVSQAETDLEKEVNKVVGKIKKSATEVEKNLDQYKKKAVSQKVKFEKILNGKKAAPQAAQVKRTVKKKTAQKKAAVRK
jgi:hypothetical protein